MNAEDWRSTTLGEFLRIKHGFAFKSKNFSDSGHYIVLTPGNFRAEGGLKLKGDKEKYHEGEFPREYLLEKQDLIVVLTDLKQDAPILGSAAFIPEDDRFLHNQRLGKVVELDVDRIDEHFLFYLFNYRRVREQLKATATGATLKHTAPDRIYAVEVEIPPLQVQRKIAAVLSAYDDLIENNTRRIAILEEMAQAIYREWFVHFRFPGHEDVDFVEIDTEVGEVPVGWEVVKLKEVCHLTLGQSPPSKYYNEEGEGLPFHQGVADFGDRFPVDRRWCTITKRTAEPGDILFSVRAPVGRMNLARRKIVIGRGLHAIRSKTGHQAFIYQQLQEKFHEEDMMGGGTIFKSVTKKDMQNIALLMPPQELRDRFERLMESVYRLLEILIDKNENLRETRDLLLPRLVSGELDVSELEVTQPDL